MRVLALLCVAGAAWGSQATSNTTSVSTSGYEDGDDTKGETASPVADDEVQDEDGNQGESAAPVADDEAHDDDEDRESAARAGDDGEQDDDEDDGESVTPVADDDITDDEDDKDESMVQSETTAGSESGSRAAVTGWSRAMRVHRARHVRWMRKWSRRYTAWFRRSTRTYRARQAAARRSYATAKRNLRRSYRGRVLRQWRAGRVNKVVQLVREYIGKLRVLRIRHARALRAMALRYVRSRRQYRAAQLRRRSAHIRRYRRRMAQLKRLRRRRWSRRRRGGRRVVKHKLVPVRRNRLIGTVRASKGYQVSFNIKPFGTRPGWSNVLHFMTSTRGGTRRIPAVWFYSRSTRLHIRAGRRGNWGDGCDPGQRLPKRKTTKVTIRVAHGRMDVFYNRRLVCRNRKYRHPTAPKQRVKLYVGGPWHPGAPAHVSQVVYRRLGRAVRRTRGRPGSKKVVGGMVRVRRNRLIGTVRAVKSYQVSFNIKPWGTGRGWRNVLHFTTGRNRSRIPAVWFFSRSTRLHIRAGRRGSWADGCDPRQHLPRHRTTKVTIRVAYGRMDVFYNRRLVCRNRNYRFPTVPRKRVKVYVADPWHHPAPAHVGQVVYRPLSRVVRRTRRRGQLVVRRMRVLRRNKYVGKVRGSRNYQVSFNIKPWGTGHWWRNVLHFTTGRNRSRLPGVWFFSRTSRLHIRAGRRGSWNDGCDPRKHLPRHRTTKVTIRVAYGRMDVFYNRRLVCRNRNYRFPTVPRKRVKVYLADRWHHTAPARVGQVVYKRLR